MITLEKEESTLLSPLCCTNVNMFWGGVIAEVLARLGVEYAVIAPGSRSGPLTIGCASNKRLKTIPILDERSAGFFALGLAKQTHRPVILICSSGTAAANFYPAIIEARMSKVPLIVLTADRPPEARECHSGQTIDQVKLYGDYAVFYKELALPEANFDLFYYLRQMVKYAYECATYRQRGPVHLNVPFRDPLSPVTDEAFRAMLSQFDLGHFFDGIVEPIQTDVDCKTGYLSRIYDEIMQSERVLIIVGTVEVPDPQGFCLTLSLFAYKLGCVVLAEGLSPVRNYNQEFPALVTRYDTILRNPEIAELLRPDYVIQIGNLPTSKVLRAWLKTSNVKTLVLEGSFDNIDPTHGNTTFLRVNPIPFMDSFESSIGRSSSTDYVLGWNKLQVQADELINSSLEKCEDLFEGKIGWLLSKHLPQRTPIFIATSMPVRDVEFFWQKNTRKIKPYFNRGANGIDGIVSTALGVAHDNEPAVLLVGDLAFLHDGNGLLIKNYFKGSLTIVLINNDGGRLFEFLPIAQFGSIFEEYFVTPQNANFEKLAHYHGFDYYQPKSWDSFCGLISDLPTQGIRIIEMVTDGKKDVTFRKNLFKRVSESIRI